VKKEISINFIQYAFENLETIKVPNSKEKYYKIENLENVCELLILFLNYEIDDISLKRVLSNFENEFQIIYDLDLKQLSSAIESLAANFEPFLKKLAYIKFNNNDIWQGSINQKGIKDCTLFELIEGGFSINSSNTDEKFKVIEFPNSIVSKTGQSKSILDFVRSHLRNSVHNAKTYTRVQLAEYSNLVLSSYLIAINDNLDFLKEKFFIEYDYLKQITNSNELKNINNNYVDVLGKELNPDKTINNFSNIEFSDLDIDNENDFIGIDTIINIANDKHNFIIIGEPGSGKSTTLKNIVFKNAIKILENANSAKFPILINASLYSKQNNFDKLIYNSIIPISLDYLLNKYKVTILIDGLNEIDDEYKSFALKELIHTLNTYKNVDFIITTRKFGFYNNLNIQVYELKSFNELQIKDFIKKGLTSTTEANDFWTNIENNRTVFEIVSNPLMLNMFLNVFKNENKNFPQNKALLYKLFIDKILEREKSFYNTKIKTKIDILSYIAFWMRSNGYFKNINSIKAKELINIKLLEIDHSIGSNQIIDELIDNNIIIENDENIQFQHETIQEYFVALELKNQFQANDKLKVNISENKWIDSLIMCAQLLKTEKEIINFYNLTFIGQKNNIIKPINLFDENDVNSDFYIGCKISYHIKDTNPNVYKLTELHLHNYITLWLVNYKKNIQIFNFENLLVAIASLSSVYIFKLFFSNISILEFLFHNNDNESININSENNINFEDRFYKFANIFSKSLSNTANFYKANTLISEHIDKLFFLNISKTIKPNYRRFLQYILNESSTSQLIEVFNVEYDKEILFFIGATDLSFFVNNYELIKNFKPQKVVNFLLKYHFKNPTIFEAITNIIKKESTEIDVKCEIIYTLLKYKQFYEDTFNFLRHLKSKNELFLLEDSFKLLLNNYPIEILKYYELDTLYITPNILEDKLILNRLTIDEKYNIYDINDFKKNLILTNDIYLKEKKVFFDFITIEYTHLRIKLQNLNDLYEIIKEYEENKLIILEYNQFNIDSNSTFYKLKLNGIKKSKRFSNSINLYLDCELPNDLNLKNNNIISLHLKNKFQCTIDWFDIYKKREVLAINVDSNLDLNDIIQIRIVKPNILFDKPHLYHRDIFKNNKFYTNYLESKINDPDKYHFYKKLSLLHLNNNNNFSDINYGVIINDSFIQSTIFIVYSITKNKVIPNYLYASSGSNLKVNDIVIIENNIHISPTRDIDNIENFFYTSTISSYSIDKSEGFITNLAEDKDYYFITRHSNYLPKIGDYVKFIPGINFSKKANKMLPMAFAIEKIIKPNRIATVIRALSIENNSKDCFEYLLLDEITNKVLFTRIYTTSVNSINHQLEIGEKYIYTEHSGKNSNDQIIYNRSKRVIVLELI
jgi:hypothetical protein